MVAPHLPRLRAASCVRLLATMTLGAILTAGCMTGQRPSFDDEQPAITPTGDAAIDAVLERLDEVAAAGFTADYSILTRLGDVESTATVVHSEGGRRSITINDIRFLDGAGTPSTCDLTTDECEASLNDARVSDVQVSHDFYGASTAQRLRVDAARKIDDAGGHDETFAGQPAVCADVPVTGGTKVYCALDSGLLAKYDGNDVLIELTGYSATPDESAFTTN